LETRLESGKVEVEKDNNNETLVKPEWLEVRKTKAVVIEEIKQAGVKMLRDEKWRKVNGIMYKEEKVYVPKDDKLRVEIIRLYYDTPIGEYGRQWKIVELVTCNFWWPGVTKEVKQYVEEYNAC